VVAFDRAFRQIDRGRGERATHVLEADAVRAERSRIDLDAGGVGFLTEDRDLADPATVDSRCASTVLA